MSTNLWPIVCHLYVWFQDLNIIQAMILYKIYNLNQHIISNPNVGNMVMYCITIEKYWPLILNPGF